MLHTHARRHSSTPPTLVSACNLHPTVSNDSRVLLEPRAVNNMHLQTCGRGYGNHLARTRAAWLAVAKPFSLSYCWDFILLFSLFVSCAGANGPNVQQWRACRGVRNRVVHWQLPLLLLRPVRSFDAWIVCHMRCISFCGSFAPLCLPTQSISCAVVHVPSVVRLVTITLASCVHEYVVVCCSVTDTVLLCASNFRYEKYADFDKY